FPGGATLDPELPNLGPADPMQLSKQLLGLANAALAPLGPVFNLIDMALALFNAVKAIPDAISHLDPSKISDALPELAQKAAKLAGLGPLPNLSSLGSDVAAALQPLEVTVRALQQIRDAVPV